MQKLTLGLRLDEIGNRMDRSNVCMTSAGISGTVIGFDVGLGIGEVNPTQTRDGTPLYSFTWDYPAVKGDFVISWGLTGETLLTDVSSILVVNPDGTEAFIAYWDDGTKSYNATSLVYAQALNESYDAGELEPWCLNMLILPGLFIHYTLNELLTGEA